MNGEGSAHGCKAFVKGFRCKVCKHSYKAKTKEHKGIRLIFLRNTRENAEFAFQLAAAFFLGSPLTESGQDGDVVTVDATAGTVEIRDVVMKPTVSSAVLVDGKVLMLKRPDRCHSFPGMWSLVAGKIEPGETPEQAARREIAEETGLEVGAPDASTRPVHVREGSILWRVHPFLFRLDSAEPVLNDENEAFEWVSPEDIQSRETVVDTFLVVDRMLNNQ